MRNIVLLTALIFLLATAAMAVCNDPQPRLVCAEYFDSEVLVIAKLTHTTHVTPKNEQDGHVYAMSTQKVLRGKMEPTFSIYEENSSGRAPFDWKIGRSYLLFLSHYGSDRFWELDGCGNSSPVKEAAFVLRTIDRIQRGRKGGLIQVVVHPMESSANPGVKIGVHGDQGDFAGKTDSEGEFKIHVPAGKYKVHAVSKGWSFKRGFLSYSDPNDVRVENGGCVQLQLDVTEAAK